MNNKTNGICCGGDYTAGDKIEYSQTSPSKRHNVSKEVENIRLANYIAVYVQDHIASVRSLSDLIYAALEKFHQE